jgi:hypothetical protein
VRLAETGRAQVARQEDEEVGGVRAEAERDADQDEGRGEQARGGVDAR